MDLQTTRDTEDLCHEPTGDHNQFAIENLVTITEIYREAAVPAGMALQMCCAFIDVNWTLLWQRELFFRPMKRVVFAGSLCAVAMCAKTWRRIGKETHEDAACFSKDPTELEAGHEPQRFAPWCPSRSSRTRNTKIYCREG